MLGQIYITATNEWNPARYRSNGDSIEVQFGGNTETDPWFLLRELYEACEQDHGHVISGDTRYALAILAARKALEEE